NINEAEVLNPILPPGAEWYYEIENENGSITYQYLYQAGDTIVQDEPTHILVKINTLYDKDLHQDVTHEYVYERDGKVYWWNKTLEEFTVLYDFGAHEGDSWTIKVGTESLIMHVDAVEEIEYEGKTYRMLRVSDPEDLFSGDIVCGIGHLTSFFPERLMDNGDGIRVEGMRCYWVENELVFKYGDEDCDAIYSEVHGLDEEGPSTLSTGLVIYPNPTDGTLFVQTLRATSLLDQTYRIINLIGQIVLSGNITAEIQQIDVSSLPQGMYFITFAGETRKFVVR
ncbi:MAG: T9SS type A sorting domain-containing protein, partial [Bacteroidales bacterium]|nr:T9SS type A sorting domain-containing protein [Bacteroidales bacterium]